MYFLNEGVSANKDCTPHRTCPDLSYKGLSSTHDFRAQAFPAQDVRCLWLRILGLWFRLEEFGLQFYGVLDFGLKYELRRDRGGFQR